MMTEEYKQKMALFRYEIIAPLITRGETTPQERGQFFRDASGKTYETPDGKRSG